MTTQRWEVGIFNGKSIISTQIVEAESKQKAEDKVEANFKLKFIASKAYDQRTRKALTNNS